MILSKASSLMSEQRAVIGIHRRIAHQDVDLAVVQDRPLDQHFDFLAVRDVAGDDVSVAARFADALGDFLAGVNLAAGDHDLGAEFCQ
jgi:ATP phosphoribosyltransferase regulatory subunit HisZ